MIRGVKRGFLLCAVFVTAGLACRLYALDLTVIGGAGNYSFDLTAKKPIGDGEFKGSLYPLGRISLSDRISTTFSYSATLERDPMLRNLLICEMTIESGFFKLSVGPLLGLFSTVETPLKPGVSAGVCLEFPGIIFFDLRGGASFGTIREKGDYSLETSRIAFGFWLPNLVNTLSLTSQRFDVALSNTLLTGDELLRICNRVDIYAKNIPYTVSIDIGYQVLKRSYDGQSNGEDLFRSVFLGFETAITVRPNFTIRFGAEIPAFVWGKEPLARAKDRWFFQAFAGFTWTIEKTE